MDPELMKVALEILAAALIFVMFFAAFVVFRAVS